MAETASKPKVHHGHNLLLKRKEKHLKQDTVARDYGCSQTRISQLENQETISNDILQWFADYYKMRLEDLRDKEVELEAVSVSINNTFNDHSQSQGSAGYYQNNSNVFNSIEEFVKLCREKDELHAQLLKNEQERNSHLIQLMDSLSKQLGKK